MAIYTIGASGSEPALAAVETAHLPTENRPALAIESSVILASTSWRSGSHAEAEIARLTSSHGSSTLGAAAVCEKLGELGELQNPGSPIRATWEARFGVVR
jgi:hypothetical protein